MVWFRKLEELLFQLQQTLQKDREETLIRIFRPDSYRDQIAYGSASEVEYLILLSAELNYVPFDIAIKMNLDIQEIKKMLTSLLKKLKTEN